MLRSLYVLLLTLPALSMLSGCGGEAIAGSATAQNDAALDRAQPRPLSAVQALDYCDAFMGWEKIDCLDRVAEGKDPSQLASR